MNGSIKELRTALGLTQQEFADKIKVKRNTVATYEMGRSIPSDSAIALICQKFNVNEKWLRLGQGEMFRSVGSNEDSLNMAACMGYLTVAVVESDIDLQECSYDFRDVIHSYAKLSNTGKKCFVKFFETFLDEIKDASN